MQPRDKAAILVVNTTEFFSKNVHENGVQFPKKKDAFVLDLQHGLRDVTSKLAIEYMYQGKFRR